MNSQTEEGEFIYSNECDLKTLSDTQAEIENSMQGQFEDDIKLNFVTLSIVEALANVFHHGGDENANALLTISKAGSTVTATIKDDGKQIQEQVIAVMSGEASSMPSIDVQIDDLPESGWGLNLIQHACSSVNYRREEPWNYLELNFDSKAEA